MKIHGYCTSCHKIKRVTCRMPLPGQTAQGICDDCETARSTPPPRGVVSPATATPPEEDPNGSQHRD